MPAKRKTFSPKARHVARERVLQALYQWQLTGQNTQLIESQFLDESTLSKEEDESEEPDMQKADIPYFKQLLHSIPEKTSDLDKLFAPFLDRKITQLDPVELAILRIGSYELTHCQDIPFKVVINEAVELAKQFGAEQSHKYINGVLDKLAHSQQKSTKFTKHKE
ncbi:transcription antitermination protein NusB [Beggiatoa sp. PS]|nr:transcription antitermination protein NusB [Beggiatoa sp. PS]